MSRFTTLYIMCALALAGCAVQPQPGDPAVTARIVGACVDSGLFKIADGLVAAAVPAASLPIAVVNAGVDRVCANPAAFSADISTAEWVAKNLASKL
jgi:hypothetical protein